jgi:transcriptional regulator with XRE-family HTH domain
VDAVSFENLQLLVLEAVRERVRNGELTERRLARYIGISQPHIHNVLKGARSLSPEIADRILKSLRISLLDLLNSREWTAGGAAASAPRYAEVPLLEGRIGPRVPLPTRADPVERYPWRLDGLAGLVDPRFARLASDPPMHPLLGPNDLVLLDHSEHRRAWPEPDGLYLVNREGEGAIRWLRLGPQAVYLVTLEAGARPERWEKVPLGSACLAEFVRARVACIVRQFETLPAVQPAGGAPPALTGPALLDRVRVLRERTRKVLAAGPASPQRFRDDSTTSP